MGIRKEATERSVRGNGRFFAAVALAIAMLAAGTAGAADGNPVRIGIMPSDGARVLVEKYQPLMDYLARKTGRPFEVHPLNSYEEIIEELKSGQIDGGVLGSFKAYEAIRTVGAEPLARPEKGEVSSYRGVVVVRKDSGCAKIQDLRGKSFDCVSRGTSAGYIFPMALLRESRIQPESFFSKVTFAGRHEITLAKVLNREVDGGAVKDTVYDRLAKSDPRVKAELAVIHKSGSFPDGTFLFRKGTPAELTTAVKKALLELAKVREGKPALDGIGADRFIETDKRDFSYLAKLVKRMEGK